MNWCEKGMTMSWVSRVVGLVGRRGRRRRGEVSEYCRNCGHAKEAHNLNVSGENEKVCHEMSGDHGDHDCICVGFMSWSGR